MVLKHVPRPEKKVYVTLRRRGKSVSGNVAVANRRPEALTKLKLDSSASIEYRDRKLTLEEVIDKFQTFGATEQDPITSAGGQLEVGRHLYQQIFGSLRPEVMRSLRGERVDLRVVTDDKHLLRLPWSLIADTTFLSASGWSVSMSAAADDCRECPLPPSPKILVITPESPNWGATLSDEHVRKLEALLSSVNHLHKRGRHLLRVSTWEETQAGLQDFSPDILYYYGHGEGDNNSSRLVFTSAPPGEGARVDGVREKLVPAIDFAAAVRKQGDKAPRLAYINCCQGDAGGLLGFGKQLSAVVPAVVTNYTVAFREAAQNQALAFWKGALVDGDSPHEAVASMRGNLVEMGLTFDDLRWMTPVLHSRYSKWSFARPGRSSRRDRDVHWRYQLNRVHQFSQVLYQTKAMLERGGPRALAYVWYGRAGQGVQQFYQRLEAEMPYSLPDVRFESYRPSWPVEFHNFSRSMEDMLTQVFGIGDLDELPAKLQSLRGYSGRRELIIYLQHPPVTPEMKFSLRALRTYLEWLDTHFANLLPDRVYALIGLSFVVGKPEAFRRAVLEKERLNEAELNHVNFHLLEELRSLERNDVVEFLRAQNMRWPSDRREMLLSGLMAKTGGDYEAMLEEIKALDDRAWDLTEETLPGGNPPADPDYDYN